MWKVTYIDYKGDKVVMTFTYYYQAQQCADGIPIYRLIEFSKVEVK